MIRLFFIGLYKNSSWGILNLKLTRELKTQYFRQSSVLTQLGEMYVSVGLIQEFCFLCLA